MSDNQDLKSKILLMRQKNFGEVVNDANEKNDNQKPVNVENTPNNKEVNKVLDQHKNDIDQNTIKEDVHYDISPDISELKKNLNEVAKTNEKAFDLLASKFNESVEVILELSQRVEKLETVTKLQSMQESVKKTEIKPSQKGIKFFLFLLFVASISYFFYKFNIDLSILKDISRDFLAILGK